jgi:uncharacterized repeat protein (TIGR03803 family)
MFRGLTQGFAHNTVLILDQQGNLYDTTEVKDINPPGCTSGSGCGVMFNLSQTLQEWDITEVDDFPGNAGSDTPWDVSLVGSKLYGVTKYGGASGAGAIFEITP